MKVDNEGASDLEFLQQYAIDDKEGEFEKTLQNGVNISASGIISVKSSISDARKHEKSKESSKSKRKEKGEDRSRSNKKKKSEKR